MSVKKKFTDPSGVKYTIYFKDNASLIRHREDGPAFIAIYKSNDCYSWWVKSWWIDGKLHRVNGHAIMRKSGHNDYYLNGKFYPKEDYKAIIRFGDFF